MSGEGRVYPRRPCSKCGMPYASNILPQHQDQCSGEVLIETAKKSLPRKKGKFIWATWDNVALHAIIEQQIYSAEVAFCEHAPEGPGRHWDPAELYMLGLDPRLPGRALKKCPSCVRLTQTVNDTTLRIIREIEADPDDNDDEDTTHEP